ncbi:MAG TPA: hypothetical protein VE967_02210 [Gemmatimonadaceae bacterium]|nr:hypothetical protein [Gemmatimonadaceae bacterium]
MTRSKDFKRLVRDRMRKTGEAYTAARAQLLKQSSAPTRTRATRAPVAKLVAPARPDPKEYAALAGMSDAALKAKTGCTWEKWVRTLDHRGADKMSHREIVALTSKYKAGPWWSQMVAVGYERIRGLRTRTQQRDGSYMASKSRTFNVPVTALFDAWSDAAARREWFGDGSRVRSSTAPKSMRLGLEGGASVVAMFTAKGGQKSSVAVEQQKLASKDDVARFKEDWSLRFDQLAKTLTV